jgi:hypothetical protein
LIHDPKSGYLTFSIHDISLRVVPFPLTWISDVFVTKLQLGSLNPNGVSRLLLSILGLNGATPPDFSARIAQAGQALTNEPTNYCEDSLNFLGLAFPGEVNDLTDCISDAKWMSDVYWELAQNDRRSIDVVETTPALATCSDRKSPQVINNPLVAVELVYIRHTLSDPKNRGKCVICSTFCSTINGARCAVGHLICCRCLQPEVERFLAAGPTTFSCPSMNCQSCVPLANLLNKIPHELVAKAINVEADRLTVDLGLAELGK